MSAPAGGFKRSGYGKHNGCEAVRECSPGKSVMADRRGKTQDAFAMRVR